MEDHQKSQKIWEFIRKHKLAVISTVTADPAPEAAVIQFGETESLELIFDTFASYRKYQNLQHNQRVAFVIGWDENITVQYEGVAVELSGDDIVKYQTLYFHKNSKARKWATHPEIRYFKVTPKWIRYSDLSTDPWEIFELQP